MTALFAGLTTLDVLHRLDHAPDPTVKVTSTGFTMAAGGPATNAAVTYAALCAASRRAASPERPRPRVAPGSRTGESGVEPGAESGDAPLLLTALGEGPVAAFLAADLACAGVRVADATARAEASSDRNDEGAAAASARVPAVSSIIEHPEGRMVASTNARLDVEAWRIAPLLPTRVGVVLIDGHNPSLAREALTLGIERVDEGDPFALLEAEAPHPRILDGGSWKDWLTSLLGLVDIAVVSEDFCPPVMARPNGEQVADFLRGFGITRTVRTRGERSVQYWWDGARGEVPVRRVEDSSTLGAGDAFHGAFAWAIERAGDADPEAIIRFASAVAGVSVSSFGTRRWRASPELEELVRGW
ncbi:PfkB family carbohydrate kinase [Cellulomonas flavigena]|uniref:PfkB family carbohydrate kinase n=1 Tax=Cellulomonas flavigena TaxID=1711 RepID=UPI00065FF071|nr:PfkB family carbohydrate kinase [Cellulomonas flavigena]